MVEELPELAHPVAVGQRIDGARDRRDTPRRIVLQAQFKLEGVIRIRRVEALEAYRRGAIRNQVADVAGVKRIVDLAADGGRVADGDNAACATRGVGERRRNDVVLGGGLEQPVEGVAREQGIAGAVPEATRGGIQGVIADALQIANARRAEGREPVQFLRKELRPDAGKQEADVRKTERGHGLISQFYDGATFIDSQLTLCPNQAKSLIPFYWPCDTERLSMNLRRLECFVAVAEAGNFRRAAKALSLSQPGVSVHVAQLEAELGVTLLERNRRGLALTAAGTALLSRARVLLPALREALAEAAAVGEGRVGTVRIGFWGSASYQFLPRALRLAEREFPDARILLRQMRTESQVAALLARELDLAIVREPSVPMGVAATLLIAENFMVALPSSHPLATERRIGAEQLHAQPMVTLPTGSGPLRDAMMAELADAGATAVIVDEVTDMATALGLVSAGRGLALVPSSVSRLRMPGIAFRPLAQPRRRAEQWLWRRSDDNRPLVTGLFELLVRSGSKPPRLAGSGSGRAG
ncbi:LysR family transcriptional regulator [bacterium]|nr:LysR family transcriptional regulator [bacterium]